MSSDFLQAILPEGWKRPRGYSNGVLAPAGSRPLAIAGMIGWDGQERFTSDTFAGQFRQALANVVAVVREAGGGPEHITRLTIYVTDKTAYSDQLPDVGAAYKELMGKNFPAMALLEVKGLLEPQAMVEIEADAALPA